MAPLQALSGHAAAQMVASSQPVKFAAMEGHFRTEAQAPLRIGGLPDEAAMDPPYAIEIPYALSILALDDPGATVVGLEEFPRDEWPPVSVVHIAFQIMVGLGSLLILLAAWAAIRLVRKLPWATHRPLLAACVLSAPAAILALEAGWVVTEVGRQPWIAQGLMRTEKAMGEVPAIGWVFGATLVLYAGLAAAATAVLAVGGVLGAWVMAHAPHLPPSGLSLIQAAAPVETLRAMLWVCAIGMLLIVPALALLFHLFKTSAHPSAQPDHDPSH